MNNDKPNNYAKKLGELLEARGWMFACAESCTGGTLAAAMTDNAGASQWFDRGFITYSNEAKMEMLRVGVDTLERFGAVSEETAMEMASGVLAVTGKAQLAVSVTGLAGPGGGSAGKPVGMVCFGFAQRAGGGVATRAVTRVFQGDRQQVRTAAVEFALCTAIDIIEPN